MYCSSAFVQGTMFIRNCNDYYRSTQLTVSRTIHYQTHRQVALRKSLNYTPCNDIAFIVSLKLNVIKTSLSTNQNYVYYP